MTKFDVIQLVFNALLVVATVLNLLVMFGLCERWVSFVGFVLATGGCLMTNSATGGKQQGQRQQDKNKFRDLHRILHT